MPSWGSKIIFPLCLQVSDVATGDEFNTIIEETISDETRFSLWDGSRMIFDIGSLRLSEAQRRTARWFSRAVAGQGESFLFRRFDDPEFEMLGPDGQGEFLGTGNGAQTAFQCRIYDSQQGKPASYVVKYLDHDYPANGFDRAGVAANPTRHIEVRVDGALKTLGTDYTVSRETGVITFTTPPAVNAIVTAKGAFYVLVRCAQDRLPLKPMGAGEYELGSGVKFIEPKGGR